MRIESWRGRPEEAERRRGHLATLESGEVVQRKESRWARGMSGRGKSERGFEKKDEGGRAWIAEITFATFATS